MNRRCFLMLALVGLLVCSQSLVAQEKKKKRPPGASGTVKSVDAEKRMITITTRSKTKDESQDRTFKVAESAKVTIDGEEKTLADVKPGARVRLRLEGEEVVAIRVGERKKKE